MTPYPAGTPLDIAAARDKILAEAEALSSRDPVLRELAASYDLNGLFAAIDDSISHPQSVTAGPDELLRSESIALADAAATYSVASLQALYLSEAVWDWAVQTFVEVETERAGRLAFATAWILRLSGLRKLEEADRLRFRDDLTTLLNRTAFDRDLVSELAKASAEDPIAVVVIDIDGLKQINGRYGHLAGNRLLREFAAFLGEAKGSDGYAYRWAGDEFALLLRRTNRVLAMHRMQSAMALSPARFSWGVSVGESSRLSPQALVEEADGQMYEMKASHKGLRHRLRTRMKALISPGRPRRT